MTPTDSGERRANLKSALLEHLHDPLKLRIFVIAVVLSVGYAAVYKPLGDQISDTTQKLAREKKLLALGGNIERLQGQYRVFEGRLPQSDNKEWVQHVLEGIRRFPVKMVKLDCCPSKKIGPYRVVVLQIELEGPFLGLDQFLRWLESDRRLLRADEVRISPAQGAKGSLVMRVTVLGLTG